MDASIWSSFLFVGLLVASPVPRRAGARVQRRCCRSERALVERLVSLVSHLRDANAMSHQCLALVASGGDTSSLIRWLKYLVVLIQSSAIRPGALLKHELKPVLKHELKPVLIHAWHQQPGSLVSGRVVHTILDNDKEEVQDLCFRM